MLVGYNYVYTKLEENWRILFNGFVTVVFPIIIFALGHVEDKYS